MDRSRPLLEFRIGRHRGLAPEHAPSRAAAVRQRRVHGGVQPDARDRSAETEKSGSDVRDVEEATRIIGGRGAAGARGLDPREASLAIARIGGAKARAVVWWNRAARAREHGRGHTAAAEVVSAGAPALLPRHRRARLPAARNAGPCHQHLEPGEGVVRAAPRPREQQRAAGVRVRSVRDRRNLDTDLRAADVVCRRRRTPGPVRGEFFRRRRAQAAGPGGADPGRKARGLRRIT